MYKAEMIGKRYRYRYRLIGSGFNKISISGLNKYQ